MKTQNIWYYPTNQMNLGYSLARGLITDPVGYGDKYYSDLLQDTPGWLPLFSSLDPGRLKRVTQDAPYLVPVVLEMELGLLQGSAWALNNLGEWEAVQLPEVSSETHTLLLLPLPLPITLFRKVYFPDANAKKDCLDRWQSQYGNIPIPDKRWFGTRKTLFQRKAAADIFNEPKVGVDGLPGRATVDLDHADTLGALRALLFHYAHRWQSACEFYEWLFLNEDAFEPQDRVLRQARSWCDNPTSAEVADDEVGLFWFLVNRLQESRANATDTVLRALEEKQVRMPEKFQQRLEELIETLRGLRGLGGQTLDELFDANPKPFSRALILFFVRDSSRQLLDLDQPRLEPADVLYALILFAARDGWLALDRDLRHGARFISETNNFMARMLQQPEHKLEWESPKPPLLPLYRRLAPAKDGREEKKAAQLRLDLARKMKWDCIHTSIQLPPGSYPMNVSRAGIEIRFTGEPRYVVVGVDNDSFFKQLEQMPLPRNIAAEIFEQ